MLNTMAHYGVDKPDIRFDMTLKDLSDFAAKSQFSVFAGSQEGGQS